MVPGRSQLPGRFGEEDRRPCGAVLIPALAGVAVEDNHAVVNRRGSHLRGERQDIAGDHAVLQYGGCLPAPKKASSATANKDATPGLIVRPDTRL